MNSYLTLSHFGRVIKTHPSPYRVSHPKIDEQVLQIWNIGSQWNSWILGVKEPTFVFYLCHLLSIVGLEPLKIIFIYIFFLTLKEKFTCWWMEMKRFHFQSVWTIFHKPQERFQIPSGETGASQWRGVLCDLSIVLSFKPMVKNRLLRCLLRKPWLSVLFHKFNGILIDISQSNARHWCI